MSLIICPECNEEVSEYAEVCPNCGFPIKNFKMNNKLTDTSKIWICPKCAEYEYEQHHLRCRRCNIPMIQTDIEANVDNFEKTGLNYFKKTKLYYEDKLAKESGGNIFSQEEAERRRMENRKRFENRHSSAQTTQPTSSQVTCPYCKSTNTKKISAVSRASSIGLFGIFSKKVGKQWHCNNCGSDF